MKSLLALAIVLLVTSCGTPVCVGGVGECGYDPASSPKGTGTPALQGGGSSGHVVMISALAAPAVTVGNRLEFKAAGGTPPYTYKMTYPTPFVGSLDSTSGVYQAPNALVSPATKQEVRVQASDSQNNLSIELPFWVLQTP